MEEKDLQTMVHELVRGEIPSEAQGRVYGKITAIIRKAQADVCTEAEQRIKALRTSPTRW